MLKIILFFVIFWVEASKVQRLIFVAGPISIYLSIEIKHYCEASIGYTVGEDFGTINLLGLFLYGGMLLWGFLFLIKVGKACLEKKNADEEDTIEEQEDESFSDYMRKSQTANDKALNNLIACSCYFFSIPMTAISLFYYVNSPSGYEGGQVQTTRVQSIEMDSTLGDNMVIPLMVNGERITKGVWLFDEDIEVGTQLSVTVSPGRLGFPVITRIYADSLKKGRQLKNGKWEFSYKTYLDGWVPEEPKDSTNCTLYRASRNAIEKVTENYKYRLFVFRGKNVCGEDYVSVATRQLYYSGLQEDKWVLFDEYRNAKYVTVTFADGTVSTFPIALKSNNPYFFSVRSPATFIEKTRDDSKFAIAFKGDKDGMLWKFE